ncbi:MAG: 50S ribosomal protein L7/L12 [Candidatus Pacebacteria bacterium]|nr:50S ribosomal protein L7/L12 [Candidatus Paceibacterota bacterium]
MAEEEKKEIEVPENLKGIVEEIENMKLVDLAKLVKILEEKFGVSSQVPMVSVPAGAVATAGQEEEEKTEFNVELKDAGSSKIQVIKLVKEITGKGLKESKDLVDGAPVVIKEKVKKEEADEIKAKLEEAGAVVEIK